MTATSSAAPPMLAPSIFVSYRRNDAAAHAGRLYERLVREFPVGTVYRDVDSTAPGADYVDVIEERLQGCIALVAVIGPRWASARRGWRRRRLHEPDDWVRREIATAFGRAIPVFPVLVDGAAPPRAGELPDVLKPLARLQALSLPDEGWGAAVERLIEALPRPARDDDSSEPARLDSFPPPFADVLTPLGRDRECEAAAQALVRHHRFEYAGPPGVGCSTLLRYVATRDAAAKRHRAAIAIDPAPTRVAPEHRVEELLWWIHGRLRLGQPADGVHRRDRALAHVDVLLACDDLELTRRELTLLRDKLPSSTFLIAGRTARFDDLPGRTEWLDGLAPEAAIGVFEQHARRPLEPDERPVVRRLCVALEGFPWHIRVVANLVARERLRIAALAAAVERNEQAEARRVDIVDAALAHMTPEQRLVVQRLTALRCRVHIRHLSVLGQLIDPEEILEQLLELGAVKANSPSYTLASPIAERVRPDTSDEWLTDAVQYLSGWAYEHRHDHATLLEHEELLLSVLALGRNPPRDVVRLARVTADALEPTGRYGAWRAALEAGRASLSPHQSPEMTAHLAYGLGALALREGKLRRARSELRRALTASEHAGDPVASARIRRALRSAGGRPARAHRSATVRRTEPIAGPDVAFPAARPAPGGVVSRGVGRRAVVAIVGVFAAGAAAVVGFRADSGDPIEYVPNTFTALPPRSVNVPVAGHGSQRVSAQVHEFRYQGTLDEGIVFLEPFDGPVQILDENCARPVQYGDRCRVTLFRDPRADPGEPAAATLFVGTRDDPGDPIPVRIDR